MDLYFLNHRNEYIEFLFILNLLAYPLWDMLFIITRRIIIQRIL